MPLPTFKKLDEIPEAFRAEYEERDGAWHPKPGDDAGLKSALDAERTRADAAEKLAKKAADALQKAETKKKADEAGLTEEQQKQLRADVRAELEAEYAPFKATAETAAAENRALKLDAVAKELLGKAGFLPEKLDKVWALEGKAFDLTADGKLAVKDKPGLDPAKFIADTIVKGYPEWVKGTQATGGGATGGATHQPASGNQSAAERVIADPLGMLREANEAAA